MPEHSQSDNVQELKGGFDLGSFLASQAGAGLQESSGEFSVSHEKALEKLAQYSLVGTYTWLLKLLQAVALWEPQELSITQSREQSIFRFCPNHKFPTEFDVAETFRRGLSQKGEPLPQLCLALRALVEQAGLAFVLSINGDSPSSTPIYSGDDISRLSEGERLNWAYHPDRGVQLVVSHFKGAESITGRLFPTFTKWEPRDRKIASLLEDNAIFHPVPISFNGEVLSDIVNHHAYGFSTKFRPLVLSGVKLPEGELPTLNVPQSYERKLFSINTTPFRASRPYTKERDFDLWYTIRCRQPRSLRHNLSYFSKPVHEILWVKNGVVVERNTARGLSTTCQLTLMLSADQFSTDLSGLALIRSDERSRLEVQALEYVSRDIQSLADEPSFIAADDTDELSSEDKPVSKEGDSILMNDVLPSVSFGVLGAFWLAASTPLLPTVVLGTGVAGLINFGARQYRESDHVKITLTEKWKRVVKDDLKKLSNLSDLRFSISQSKAGAGVQRDELFQPRNDPSG